MNVGAIIDRPAENVSFLSKLPANSQPLRGRAMAQATLSCPFGAIHLVHAPTFAPESLCDVPTFVGADNASSFRRYRIVGAEAHIRPAGYAANLLFCYYRYASLREARYICLRQIRYIAAQFDMISLLLARSAYRALCAYRSSRQGAISIGQAQFALYGIIPSRGKGLPLLRG